MALFDGWNATRAHIETLRTELANERERYDRLLDVCHSMRQQGYSPRQGGPQPAHKPAMRDMDEVARDGAVTEMIDRMTLDFERRGHDSLTARSEAERIVKQMNQIREEE